MEFVKNREVYVNMRNGELIIRAPKYLNKSDLQFIVSSLKHSLIEQIENYQNEQGYIKKESVEIFGELCKVKINYRNLQRPKLLVEGKNIKISLPNKYKKMGKEEVVKKLIEKLYLFISEKELELVMEKYRVEMGLAPEDYKLEYMPNTMAKLDENKTIIINPEIVKLRKEFIYYILLHQLCHLKYKTHSKSFNEMLAKYMPEYKYYEGKLKHIKY